MRRACRRSSRGWPLAPVAPTLPPVPNPLDFDAYDAVLLDLDGTIYFEEHALPGAVELIRRLQREGRARTPA